MFVKSLNTGTRRRGWNHWLHRHGFVRVHNYADMDKRGEFDRQQEGWNMTAGWGGVRLAFRRGEGWPPGGEAWIWHPAREVEDDCRVGRLAASRGGGWLLDGEGRMWAHCNKFQQLTLWRRNVSLMHLKKKRDAKRRCAGKIMKKHHGDSSIKLHDACPALQYTNSTQIFL